MKKTLSLLLAVVMVILTIPMTVTAVSAETDGYYTYEISDGCATITDVDESISGDVTIPATLGGYPVTSIGDEAFYDCYYLASIVIPSSVTSIGDSAFSCCTSLTSIVTNDTVTIIGNYAFEYCTSLTSIVIPDSVTRVGELAFDHCTSLTSVTIGNSVTNIGNGAFCGCTSLTSIIIPDSVTSIGFGTFLGCESITSIVIPNSVTSIGDYAFNNCESLTSIDVADNNIEYKSIDGVLLTKDGTVLIQYPIGNTRSEYSIPDSVTSIGDSAFAYCYRLTSIVIPNNVTSIGEYVFNNCESLTSINVSDSNIEYKSIDGVLLTKDGTVLVQYPIGNTRSEYTIPDNVTSIGYSAFSDCTNLTSVTITDSVTSISEWAFSMCTNLTSVTIPNTVTSIGYQAFDSCSDDLVILCNIGSYAAAYAADNNITISYIDTPKYLSILSLPNKLVYPIGGTLDLSGISLSVTYEDDTILSLTSGFTVSDYDFSTAGTKVITVSLGELSVSFEVVVDPNLVVLPESDHPYANNVNQTWNYTHPSDADRLVITFSEDTETEEGYDKIYIYDGNGDQVGVYSGTELAGASITVDGNKFLIKLISDGSVTKNGFTVVSVKSAVICNHTYSEWIMRTEPTCAVAGEEYRVCSICGNEETRAIATTDHDLVYHDAKAPTDTEIGWDAYETCTKCEYSTYREIPAFSSLFTYEVSDGEATITDVNSSISGDITIPDTLGGYPVTSIGEMAFNWCTSLTSIIIPDSVTSIDHGAFIYCTSLTSVTIPDSVTSIGGQAFYECYSLTSITIPDSVTSIGNNAFEYCTSLTSVTIGNSVTSIDEWAFSGCTSLTSVTIPNSVTRISWCAFEDCTSLTSITIPDSVTEIGSSVFFGCTKLTSIYVSENNTVYESIDGVLLTKDGTELIQYPIGNTRSEYSIPDNVTSIGNGAFACCYSLTSITIPDNVTSIGNSAFKDCTNLASITIPDSVTSIGHSAFSGCTSLTGVTIGNSVTNIDNSAFAGCTSLTSVTIPDSVTSIGDHTFSGCTSLTSITIPNSVKIIGIKAFSGCTSLTSVTIGDSVTSIVEEAFSGCTSLTSINVSENNKAYKSIDGVLLTKDGTVLIQYPRCNTRSEYTIPHGVTSIDDYAFSGCTSLTDIVIPDSVTSIGWGAFRDCTSLWSITIPDSVTNINVAAFYNTSYYNDSSNWENDVLYIGNHLIEAKDTISGTYEIKDGTRTIADRAFDNCTNLNSVTIPDGVTSIGNSAFTWCGSLTSVTIPDSVTIIDNYAFSSCDDLIDITIPDSVTSIGIGAFNYTGYYNDSSNWENDVLYIGNHLIQAKNTISGTYEIKDGTRTIAGEAFNFCSKLTGIIMPDSLVDIGALAFWYCTSLVDVKLPDSLSNIDSGAFENCGSLTNVIIPDGITIIRNDTFSFSGLTSVTIPDSVTSIGSYAFIGCRLTSINIPSSVTYIDEYAFAYCDLTDIYYTGNNDDWNNVIIGYDSLDFTSVYIHYNASDPETHYVYTVIEEPGCIKDGKSAYVCSCGYSKDENIIPAIGYHSVVQHSAKSPTCTEIGWNAYETCKNCDYTTYEELPALGHDTVQHDGKAPTCTDIGWNAYETCTRCDYTTYEEIPDGHDIVQHDAKSPTCTNIGWNAYETCTRCDYTTYEEIPAGHIIVQHDAKAPTCTDIGWNAYETCTRCDYTTYEEIPATGHTYENGVCTVCGEAEPVAIIYGDANGDGKVNLNDVSTLLKYIAKWDIEMDTKAADVNCDEKINLNDVSLILKYIAKWDVTLG